jgi:hypothetical protein
MGDAVVLSGMPFSIYNLRKSQFNGTCLLRVHKILCFTLLDDLNSTIALSTTASVALGGTEVARWPELAFESTSWSAHQWLSCHGLISFSTLANSGGVSNAAATLSLSLALLVRSFSSKCEPGVSAISIFQFT